MEILAQTWFYHPSMKMSPIIFVIFVGFQLLWGTLLPGLPPGPPASWEVPHSWGSKSRMVQQKVVWIKDSKKYKHSLAEKRGFVLKTAHSRSGYLWRSSSPWGRGYGQDFNVRTDSDSWHCTLRHLLDNHPELKTLLGLWKVSYFSGMLEIYFIIFN